MKSSMLVVSNASEYVRDTGFKLNVRIDLPNEIEIVPSALSDRIGTSKSDVNGTGPLEDDIGLVRAISHPFQEPTVPTRGNELRGDDAEVYLRRCHSQIPVDRQYSATI